MGAGKTASTLRAALSQCADRIQVAFVYGYVARSQPKAGSDIDLFVVGLVNFGDGRQDYLKRLSDLVLAEISVVSTGPDRTQTIMPSPKSQLQRWLSLRPNTAPAR